MSQLTKTRAAEILQNLRDRNVLVLGDVMLDEFVWGDVTRISPEAPVPVVDVRRESMHLGGAANVLANLVALGARGSVVGVVGNDACRAAVANRVARSWGSRISICSSTSRARQPRRRASSRTASSWCVPIASHASR